MLLTKLFLFPLTSLWDWNRLVINFLQNIWIICVIIHSHKSEKITGDCFPLTNTRPNFGLSSACISVHIQPPTVPWGKPEVQHKHSRLKAPEQSVHVQSVGDMSFLEARKTNTSRVEHLQRAHFKNYYEMKRFVGERDILRRDHRRLMFLINKETQELQKTLIDINPISGYCHEAYAAHLRSVSTAFSTCKESKKAKKCGNIALNVESGNSMKSKHMFGQKHDGLGDETSGDGERGLSELKQHTLTSETYKKCSNKTYVSPHMDLKNRNDYFKASLSHFELSSSECSEKDEDKSDGCPRKTSTKSPSHITKTDLKNSSSPPTHFTLHRRARQAHQSYSSYASCTEEPLT